MRICPICNEKIVLIPSAAERARKDPTGKSAKYYEDLFPYHDKCGKQIDTSTDPRKLIQKALD